MIEARSPLGHPIVARGVMTPGVCGVDSFLQTKHGLMPDYDADGTQHCYDGQEEEGAYFDDEGREWDERELVYADTEDESEGEELLQPYTVVTSSGKVRRVLAYSGAMAREEWGQEMVVAVFKGWHENAYQDEEPGIRIYSVDQAWRLLVAEAMANNGWPDPNDSAHVAKLVAHLAAPSVVRPGVLLSDLWNHAEAFVRECLNSLANAIRYGDRYET